MPEFMWDVIVVVSFAATQSLKKARKESKFLWLDATDSWHQSRISRIKSREFTQIVALLRDRYRLSRVREIDLITSISQFDANKESKYTRKKGSEVSVFPNYFVQNKLVARGEKRLFFVGDGKYPPNRKAIKFLKKVRKSLPINQDIHLVGRNPATRSKGFVILGRLSDDALYGAGDIHLAPVFSGSGIKNKVAEPLFYGLTVITTRHGSNGLMKSKKLLVRNTPKEFAEAIQLVLASALPKELDTIIEVDQTLKLLKILGQQ
jgi:glycosyltransferase involved in cell wall biosynthesis